MNARPSSWNVVAAAVGLAALCAIAAPAHSACTYYGMDTTTTYVTAGSPTILQLGQSTPTWSAIAVRPQPGEDWDISLYQNSAASPACVANGLAGSAGGAGVVDFVIGDYAHDPAGSYYALASQFSGVSAGYLRWTNSMQTMVANGTSASRAWTGSDVIETWNVALVAGRTYAINFARSAGIDARLLVFGNAGGGTYWTGRSGALLGAIGPATFTPGFSGTYSLVVVNDDGGTGSFTLGIGTCSTPAPLLSGVPVHTSLVNDYYSFNQTWAYWTAVGVRAPAADYDMFVNGGTAGAGYPNCLSDPKSSSTSVGVVDFVIGDFNHNPVGTYYTRSLGFSGPVGADVEWDSGNEQLTVNGASVTRSTGAADVLEVWDVLLSAGQTYNFAFNPSSPNTHLLLFRNGAGGVLWTGRTSAEFDVHGCTTYAAPTSGFYGAVVVNDSGEPGTYTLGVGQAPCTCPTNLVSGVPVAAPAPNAYFRFDAIITYWGVVATRGATNADDYDLVMAGDATGNPAPACFGPALATSGLGTGQVDVAVMDFNHSPLATYYARTSRFSGASPAGVAEWDMTHGLLARNGAFRLVTVNPNDLAHAYDAYMVAGTTYTIEYVPSDPTIKLMVFENPGGGTYMVTRGSAALLTSSTINYTPAVTGYHGLVVVNDQAINGNYALRFGNCTTPLPLVAGVTQTPTEPVTTYQFNQVLTRWAAVGVRSFTTDFDTRVSATQSGPFPTCIGGSLATSSSGSLPYVDFVVGDFNHTPVGTYYLQAYPFGAGFPDSAQVEWSAGLGDVIPNDNGDIVHTTTSMDVLNAWSVRFTAGQSYTINFTHAGGANLHLLLFQNALGGTYWTSRFGAVADLTPGGGPFNYVAPTSGDYGIVVVSDDAGVDTYRLNIKTCTAPTALASGVVTIDAPENFHSFNQAASFWTAVGVRSTTDWDIDVNSSGAGGAPGICQSGLLANSNGVGTVDFVVGDFNLGANAAGTYYTRDFRFSGAATGAVEWDGGADFVNVGGALTHRATDANDVLEVWDVLLNAGQTYAIYFNRTGAADAKVLLYRNPGGAYWAPRNAAVYSNTTSGNFTAPATAFYGLVVVNDNGAAGTYDVGVYNSALAVQPGAEVQPTALRSVQPNPARAGMHVEYALSSRAPVRVQMLDLAGRVVADMEDGTRDAGVWQAGWNGLTRSGRRAAPGLYMVRLQVDGRTIGQRKVTVLE